MPQKLRKERGECEVELLVKTSLRRRDFLRILKDGRGCEGSGKGAGYSRGSQNSEMYRAFVGLKGA